MDEGTHMLAPWVVDEMQSSELGDRRLNQRLNLILESLAQHPSASLPAACGGRNELEAAYRFFNNDKTTFQKVLQPHVESTHRRMAEQDVVLLVQDTTELDVTRPQQQVEGAGPLDGSDRRGAFLHPLHAFTPDGTPLGTVWAEAWARQEDDQNDTPEQKRQRRKAAPIEEKESVRWLTGLRQAREVAANLPQTQCVCVADSEADIYEVLAEPVGEGSSVNWIVRACQDRALSGDEKDSGNLLRSQVLAQPVLLTQELDVRGREAKVSCEDRARRQPRQPRKATVEMRSASVTLRPPKRSDRQLPEVSVHVVLVSEKDPPSDDVPIEWLLLTTLPIDTAEQVQQVIAYYCTRWMVEILFRTLKSGCRVEERRFQNLDRLLPCLAVYLIVAWRTLYVCRLGRSCPDVSCEALFEASEWQSAYQVVHRKSPPKQPPTLGQMIRVIGRLGGYVERPRSDPPGPQTIWLGLQRMYDFSLAWQMFGPGARP